MFFFCFLLLFFRSSDIMKLIVLEISGKELTRTEIKFEPFFKLPKGL